MWLRIFKRPGCRPPPGSSIRNCSRAEHPDAFLISREMVELAEKVCQSVENRLRQRRLQNRRDIFLQVRRVAGAAEHDMDAGGVPAIAVGRLGQSRGITVT